MFNHNLMQGTAHKVKVNLTLLQVQFSSWCKNCNSSTATRWNADEAKCEQTLSHVFIGGGMKSIGKEHLVYHPDFKQINYLILHLFKVVSLFR